MADQRDQVVPAAVRVAAYTGDDATLTGDEAAELLTLIGQLNAELDIARAAARRPLHRERVW